MRNCLRVKPPKNADWSPSSLGAVGILMAGWAGVADDGTWRFRPDRGSGGFALYETEAKCLKYSGCKSAVRMSLAVCV